MAELAEDIKANGLLHPIVIDNDGKLIDGRNRLRACEIAGIEPRVEQLNGRDARAVIVSANLEQRNLSKGQQAMALAMLYPEPEKGGRGHKGKAAETADFSQRRLREARQILHHSRAMAEDVIADRKKFDEALRQVQAAEQASKSRGAQMQELRSKVPDIAALVDDERLTIGEGYSTRKRLMLKQARPCCAWVKMNGSDSTADSRVVVLDCASGRLAAEGPPGVAKGGILVGKRRPLVREGPPAV